MFICALTVVFFAKVAEANLRPFVISTAHSAQLLVKQNTVLLNVRCYLLLSEAFDGICEIFVVVWGFICWNLKYYCTVGLDVKTDIHVFFLFGNLIVLVHVELTLFETAVKLPGLCWELELFFNCTWKPACAFSLLQKSFLVLGICRVTVKVRFYPILAEISLILLHLLLFFKLLNRNKI